MQTTVDKPLQKEIIGPVETTLGFNDPTVREIAAQRLLKPEKKYMVDTLDPEGRPHPQIVKESEFNDWVVKMKKKGHTIAKKRVLHPIYKQDPETGGIIEKDVLKNDLPKFQKDGWKLGDYQAMTKGREIYYTDRQANTKLQVVEGSQQHKEIISANEAAIKAGKTPRYDRGQPVTTGAGSLVTIPAHWDKTFRKRPAKRVPRAKAREIEQSVYNLGGSYEAPESRTYFKAGKKYTFRAFSQNWVTKDQELRGQGYSLDEATSKSLIPWKTPDDEFINLRPGVQPPPGSTKTTEMQYRTSQERLITAKESIEASPGPETRERANYYNRYTGKNEAYMYLKAEKGLFGDTPESKLVDLSEVALPRTLEELDTRVPRTGRLTGRMLSKYAKANNVTDEEMLYQMLAKQMNEKRIKGWLKKNGFTDDAFDQIKASEALQRLERGPTVEPGESREAAAKRWKKESRGDIPAKLDIKEPPVPDLPEELVKAYMTMGKQSRSQAISELRGIVQRGTSKGYTREQMLQRLHRSFGITGGASGGASGSF